MDIVARVQGILLKPKEEWQTIKGESRTIPQLFTPYVVILAAVPAVAQFIGMAFLSGTRIPYIGRSIVGRAFLFCIFFYLASLVMAYVFGVIINALAPTFASKQDQISAMKLAIYSLTPMWVAGVLYIIPFLGFLAVLASLYGIYILYLGFDAGLMETPKDKIVSYLVVAVVIVFVLNMIITAIVMSIFWGGTLFRLF